MLHSKEIYTGYESQHTAQRFHDSFIFSGVYTYSRGILETFCSWLSFRGTKPLLTYGPGDGLVS